MSKKTDYEKEYLSLGITPCEIHKQTYFHKFSLLKSVPVTTTPDSFVMGDKK